MAFSDLPKMIQVKWSLAFEDPAVMYTSAVEAIRALWRQPRDSECDFTVYELKNYEPSSVWQAALPEGFTEDMTPEYVWVRDTITQFHGVIRLADVGAVHDE